MMDLSLSEEQQAVQDAYSALLAAHSTPADVRASEPDGFDPGLWSRAVDMGITSMGVPENMKGGGASLQDLVVVARECGAHLAPLPFVESIVAGRLIAAAGAMELTDGVIDGTVLPTLVLHPVPDEGEIRVLVPAGAVAEAVVAMHRGDLVVFQRPAGVRPHLKAVPNLGCQPIADWDLAEPSLRRTVLASGSLAASVYERAVDEWRVLMAAALNGLRATALDIGLSYIKNRKAFGTLIGAFQAVQHRLADVSVAGDGAELLAFEAAWAADTRQPNAALLASYAFSFSSRTAFMTCREALQFHGGYGVTLEYDIQLYFRRAKAWPLALGDLSFEEQRAAVLSFPAAGS
jgi:alkylation response protein AidB-like acyl-CoA dehydrogenase